MRNQLILGVLTSVVLAGLFAWSILGSGSEPSFGPVVGDLGPADVAGLPDRGGEPEAGRNGVDRTALDQGSGARVDPEQARESSRLVVQAVPTSRLVEPDRYVGVLVEVRAEGFSRKARLDRDLRARFDRLDPAREFTVLVLPDDGINGIATGVILEPGTEETIEVSLLVGGTLFGRVVGQDGVEAPRAVLRIITLPHDGEVTTSRPVILDERGEFEIRGLVPGEQSALISWGETEIERALGRIDDGQVIGPIDLLLPEGEGLSGVVAWPDGAAAARARISARPLEGSGDRVLHALADEEGRYRFDVLRPGAYELLARPGTSRDDLEGAEGYRAWGEASPPGVADLVLTGGLQVSGHIVDDLGAPISHFRISVIPRLPDGGSGGAGFGVVSEREGDEPGTFRVRGLRPGVWTLTASDRGGSSVATTELRLDGDVSGLKISLPRPGRIRGRVEDPDGQPVGGVWVYALPSSAGEATIVGRAPRRVRTDSEGNFRIDRVGAGAVSVTCDPEDPDPLTVELLPGAELEGVVLTSTR